MPVLRERWQSVSFAEMSRKVDAAMAAERPEKATVRGLWVDEVRRADQMFSGEGGPLYLTLPGAQGGDIHELIEAGVVSLAQNEASIENPEDIRLVALENSPVAYVALRQRFPGLKVLQKDLRDVLGNDNWPTGEDRAYFRARVINLDMNTPLKGTVEDGRLLFPALAFARKLATVHGDPPINWTLCLTLHGEIKWSAAFERRVCKFLSENFAQDETFAEHARATLGVKIFKLICDEPSRSGLRNLSHENQQRVMMVLVPKQIAFDAHTTGWSVDTVENLRYGGTRKRAPMVTWILRFTHDDRDADVLYRDGLARALSHRGHITARGKLERE